jgi:hypothetical protein
MKKASFTPSKIASAILAIFTIAGIFALIKDDQQKFAKCKMKHSADYCAIVVYGR